MTRFGVFGATALSLSLAIAAPVLAQEAHGNRGGHAGAANIGGPRANVGGPRMGNAGAQANFRGGQTANFRGAQTAQTNVGRSNFAARGNAGRSNFAARGNAQFAPGNAQFAQGVDRGREFRGDRGRGFRRDIAAGAVAAGVATGSALAFGNNYGYYDDGSYDPNYYGDSYAYDDGATFDTGLPLVAFDQPAAPVAVEEAVGGDASYCAERYRSYDPASGTYLGFDGLRHSCP